MRRKVLIINLEFPPVGGPGVQRVLKFVRYLPEEGWIPTVICGDRATWHVWHDESLLEEVPSNVEVCRLVLGVKDHTALSSLILQGVLFPFPTFLAEKVSQRELSRTFFESLCRMHPEPLLLWVYLAVAKGLRLHKKHMFDVVVTSGPPHITHMVGYMLKRLCPIGWVADFRDPWVDSQLHGDRLGISRRLDRIWERLVLRNADHVITVSPSWGRLLIHKLTEPNDSKVSIVYNGYDPNDIPSRSHRPTDLGSSLHIHYNGTIQAAMKPDLFFAALGELKRQEPNVNHLDLRCTFTGLPQISANIAHSAGLKGIVSDVGRLSHEESLRMCMRSDVLLLMLNDVDKTSNGQITGKVYEYMALGKTILALVPVVSDLHSLLGDYPGSYIVSSDSVGHIVKTLKLLIHRKRNGQLNSFSAPSWIDQFSRQAQTRRLASILNDLAEKGQ